MQAGLLGGEAGGALFGGYLVSDPRDDLEGQLCPDCGRTYPGPDYDGEPGFCVKPWAEGYPDPGCDPLTIKRLRERLTAISRIVRRALASGQLEKLEDAKKYLSDEPGGEWINCPRHCTVDYEPVRLVPGQRCPECREIALFDG